MDLSHICKIIGHWHSGFRCRVSGVSSKKVRAGLKPGPPPAENLFSEKASLRLIMSKKKSCFHSKLWGLYEIRPSKKRLINYLINLSLKSGGSDETWTRDLRLDRLRLDRPEELIYRFLPHLPKPFYKLPKFRYWRESKFYRHTCFYLDIQKSCWA